MHRHHHLSMIGLLLLLGLHLQTAEAANPPPQVTVRKCCPFDEELRLREDMQGESILEAVQCVPSNITNWIPKIKLKKRPGLFTPEGAKPRHITFEPNRLPLDACSEPMHAHNAVLVIDGSLIVLDRNIIISQNDRFCVERDSALYCLPEDSTMNDLAKADQAAAPRKDVGGLYPENPQMAKWQRRRTTVRKCCGQGWAYNAQDKTCILLTNRSNPLLGKQVFNESVLSRTRLDLINGFPTSCEHKNFAILGTFKQDMFDEEHNVLRLENSARELKDTEFCLEHMFMRENDTVFSSFVTVFTCAEFFPSPGSQPEQNEIPRDYRYVVYAVGLIISLIFLIATLVISFLVPSNHHALHWRCQTYYVGCLLVGDFFLAITQLAGDSILEPYCSIVASTMHFSFLAAFFWLNTMCFNIWWTFRDFRPTSLERGQELCRLRIYELYAWGFPLFIAALALLFDNLPQSEEYLRPRFGEKRCWFYGDKEIFTYFFAPIGALLIINILLFVSTTRQLTCGLWKRDDVKTTTEKSALGRVCMKLVVVMGITWILDVISWLVGGPHYFWYLTDFINAAQGFFIFCVVGLQPQIRVALKRFWNSNTGGNTTTNGPQHSSSSHGLPSMGESVTNNTFTNHTTTTMNHNNNSISSTTKVPLETVC